MRERTCHRASSLVSVCVDSVSVVGVLLAAFAMAVASVDVCAVVVVFIMLFDLLFRMIGFNLTVFVFIV